MIKPAVRTVNDLAYELCGLFFSEKMGLNPIDAAKVYCDTHENLKPFIDEILKAKQKAGVKSSKKVSQKLQGGAQNEAE